MSENAEEIKPKIPTWAIWVTGGWLILAVLGLFIFPQYNTNKLSLGDIGGYIAGVFAPIAWLWFYLSYRVQSEELQLQRKELQNSIQAQQGSEIALRQQADTLRVQTETLSEQLKISREQWDIQLKEKEKNKPKFIIKYSLLEYYLPSDEQLNSSMNIYDLLEEENHLAICLNSNYKENDYIIGLSLTLDIKNIAGDCKLKDVKLIPSSVKSLSGRIKTWDASFEELKFEIQYFPSNNAIVRKEQFKGSQFDNIFNDIMIEFNYSFGFTSDIDTYKIIYNSNSETYELEKIFLTEF